MQSYRRVEVIRCLELVHAIRQGLDFEKSMLLDTLIVELRSGSPCVCKSEDAWLIKSGNAYLAMLDLAKRHWTTNKWGALCYSSRELAEADIKLFSILDCEVVEYGT